MYFTYDDLDGPLDGAYLMGEQIQVMRNNDARAHAQLKRNDSARLKCEEISLLCSIRSLEWSSRL